MMTVMRDAGADEKLIVLYNQGKQEAFSKLVKLYSPTIHFYCKLFYAKGLLKMDLFQEGCIGLFVAMTKFHAGKGTFRAFAEVHIKNRIINAVKAATRKKHQILNDCMSYCTVTEEMSFNSGEFLSYDMVASDMPTPEEAYFEKENAKEKRRELMRLLQSMTITERLVYLEISHGISYREASESIGLSAKAIDNALRRINRKALKVTS